MKFEQGGAFEAIAAEWIRARLPYHEPIWAAFIGNKGNGEALPLPGISADQELARKRFYQAHYSFALFAEEPDAHLRRVDERAGEV